MSESDDPPPERPDKIAEAAHRAAGRQRAGRDSPEPSLGSRLGQIGALGWTIVVPILAGLLVGHWLDKKFSTGVFFSAPMVMIGAGLGLWQAWKWMSRP
ncbi:MAG: ATP synthase subunit [Methylocystaceae bacterium]|nr:MAG: ATP synthase subunit [Methylocystaceae bacterium]